MQLATEKDKELQIVLEDIEAGVCRKGLTLGCSILSTWTEFGYVKTNTGCL